jgi:hypothetical protein
MKPNKGLHNLQPVSVTVMMISPKSRRMIQVGYMRNGYKFLSGIPRWKSIWVTYLEMRK